LIGDTAASPAPQHWMLACRVMCRHVAFGFTMKSSYFLIRPFNWQKFR